METDKRRRNLMARWKEREGARTVRYIALALSLGTVFAGLWGLFDLMGTRGRARLSTVAGTCLLSHPIGKGPRRGPGKERAAMALTKDRVSLKTTIPPLDASPPAVTETATFALG
jgi:hypothetical protein